MGPFPIIQMIKFDIRWNRKSEYINCCSKKIEKKHFSATLWELKKCPAWASVTGH